MLRSKLWLLILGVWQVFCWICGLTVLIILFVPLFGMILLSCGHACDKIEKRVQKQLHLFKQLDSVEKTKLKIADLLELMWYCLEEIELGNTKFKDILLVAEKEYSKHRKVNIQADHMCDSILCRGKN